MQEDEKKRDVYRTWVCSECGQNVMSKENPTPIRWSDGHVCTFAEEKEDLPGMVVLKERLIEEIIKKKEE